MQKQPRLDPRHLPKNRGLLSVVGRLLGFSTEAKSRGGITAEEHAKQLQADPEFMRRKAEQEKALAERKAMLRVAEAPLVEDLARLGFEVESVWFLKNNNPEFRKAIPVLLDHLRRPYPDIIRAGIAQRLAVRATRKIGWRILVEEFRNTGYDHEHVKDSLGAALSGAADNSVIGELIALAKDRSLGKSRIMLLRGIKRSKLPESGQAIAELADDPELSKEIKSWRKRKTSNHS